MIIIKLPIKALKDAYSTSEKNKVEEEISHIVDDWLEDNPSFKAKRVKILWNSYYDIQGKGLPDGSPEHMSLYKAIKAALWKK